tara:strand:- start:382 stop:1020 length:639 start_codon:yes stop_codon:yes gene_type:complete
MNRQKLEKFFSSRNGSAIFPVLANLYYDQKLYKYATKVCELGLTEDPNNLEGKYIFAKSLLIQGKVYEAEKVLCDILKKCPYHLYSNLLLIQVLEELNRDRKIIKKYISAAYLMYHHHPLINQYYNNYFKGNKKKSKKNSVTTKNSVSKPNNSVDKFVYNSKLATVTMYKLLYTQKKYDHALAVLNVLVENPTHTNYAKSEIKKINLKLGSQ